MASVTLEQLLTHPKCFGLTTASPLQRASCRVAEGRPLGDLETDPSVIRAFGGIESVAHLPRVRPKEFYLVSAIRCGKSLLCASIALHIALTIDLSPLGKREVARVSVVSVDRDKAKVVMEHLMGALSREDGVLGHFLVKDPKPNDERVRIRREDGRLVDIVIAAGRKGGASLVSRWTVAAIFDEAARMQGQEDGIVNFDDMRKAVIARLVLLKGAQLVVVSSPWAARGPVYKAVQEFWGKPSDQLVLMRATGPEMCPFNWTPEAVQAVFDQPDGSYETDVLGEFIDPLSSFFTHTEIEAATRKDGRLVIERQEDVNYGAAMDPGVSGNAWTLVIAGKRDGDGDKGASETEATHFVALCKQWQGSKLAPLKAKDVFAEMKPILRSYGLDEVYTDRWAFALIREHGEDMGITVTLDESTGGEKAKRWMNFKSRIVGQTMELAPDPLLRQDLLSVVRRLTPDGMRFDLPISNDGRHADYAPAVVLAVEKACDGVTTWNAMAKWRKRDAGYGPVEHAAAGGGWRV